MENQRLPFLSMQQKVTAFLEELDAMDDQLVSSYYSGNLAEAPHALKNIKNYSFT